MRPRESADRISSSPEVSNVVQPFTAPILLFDLFDLIFVHAEVVAELVNHRLGDTAANLLVIGTRLLDRLLINGNAIRERVAIAPAAFGQRRALIEPKEGIGRLDLHLLEDLRRRRVLDNDGDVSHLGPEPPRNLLEGLFDQSLKSLPGDDHCLSLRPLAARRRGRRWPPFPLRTDAARLRGARLATATITW